MQILFKKYGDAFYYYFARDINKLVSRKRHTTQFINFKDQLIYDCHVEFFKRFYQVGQVPLRIHMLVQYFHKERIYPFFNPSLVMVKGRQYIEKRKKRYRKMIHKLQEMKAEQSAHYQSVFLKSIKTQQLEQQQNQKRYEKDVSYQSQPYDIYENKTQFQIIQQAQNILANNCINYILPLIPKDEDDLESQILYQSQIDHLVCDFKELDVDRILKQYNNLPNEKKLTNNSRQILNSSQCTIEKQFKQKFIKNKLAFYQDDSKKALQGKGFVVKTSLPKKNVEKIKQNTNFDDYFPSRNSDRIKQKKQHPLLSDLSSHDQKIKEIKRLHFKSPNIKKLQKLQELYRQKSANFSSPETDRLAIKTQRQRITQEDLEKDYKYRRIIEKLKQKNKQKDSNEQLLKYQKDTSPFLNTIKSPDKNSQRNKKIQKIRQKAVELITSNGQNSKLLNSYKFNPKAYQSSQLYALPHNLKF